MIKQKNKFETFPFFRNQTAFLASPETTPQKRNRKFIKPSQTTHEMMYVDWLLLLLLPLLGNITTELL
jgi:hypothetical protein